MQSRRRLLRVLGGGLGSAVFGSAAALSGTPNSSRPNGSNHSAPWWLLAPLKTGSTLHDGWTVEKLGAISNGAAVLTLNHSSQDPVRIHICLYTTEAKGFAHSELFDLIVMDQGAGSRMVPTELSPSLKMLEFTIRGNENNDLTTSDMKGISRMMTHNERVVAFGSRSLG